MNIGYACLLLGVPNTELKGCRMKNANEDKLRQIISHNLQALEAMIDYNILHQIRLFRISSDLIPFGSSPVNQLPWESIFAREFSIIGEKIKHSGMRISMHPGQYTILNSPDKDVVKRSVEDLQYHNRVLEALGLAQEHKLILHLGGIYGDKKQAIERFSKTYESLPEAIKGRLVLENDDKLYTIKDVYELAVRLKAPVVFDLLHHQVNPCEEDAREWIIQCRSTWLAKDGHQKIHYAQQAAGKKPGAHSESIKARAFLQFYEILENKETDVMLEVKDKNLSAIKCLLLITKELETSLLEKEWHRYRYLIMEHSPKEYQEISAMLKQKRTCPALPFYERMEHALEEEVAPGNAVKVAKHIWRSFNKYASEQERVAFLKNLKELGRGSISNLKMKRFLWKMAVKYQIDDLLEAYYFTLSL